MTYSYNTSLTGQQSRVSILKMCVPGGNDWFQSLRPLKHCVRSAGRMIALRAKLELSTRVFPRISAQLSARLLHFGRMQRSTGRRLPAPGDRRTKSEV